MGSVLRTGFIIPQYSDLSNGLCYNYNIINKLELKEI